MKRRIISVLLTMGMVASLTGCGTGQAGASSAAASSNAASSAETSEAAATTATGTSQDRPYYVKSADDVKGSLTVYTTMEETQQTALTEIWNKYYPNCKLEIQADSVGTLATKIRGDEACKADVVIGGMFAADGDTYHDILQPYTSVCDKELGYHDPSGYYTFYDVQVMCLVVNTQLEKDLGLTIEGYNDLLDPKLKGKIILAAPDASSSGWRQLQTILATMGDKFDDDKGWDYIKKLMPSCFSSTSSKDVYNLVINGEYVVGLSYESTVAALIKDGAPVRCVYMKEGNTAMAGGAAIVKNAPNLEAAKAMMDLLASKEFQDIRAKESSGRGSNTTCDLSGLPDEDTLGLKDLDYDYLSKNKEALCTKWNDLWAQVNK